jgi:hypothetical protein
MLAVAWRLGSACLQDWLRRVRIQLMGFGLGHCRLRPLHVNGLLVVNLTVVRGVKRRISILVRKSKLSSSGVVLVDLKYVSTLAH